MSSGAIKVLATALSGALLLVLGGCVEQLGSPPAPLPRDHARVSLDAVTDAPCEDGNVDACIRACKRQDDAKACNHVGVLLEFDPDNADPALASRFYQRACNATYYPGCNNLAWLYLGGHGVPQDKAHAMRLFYYAYDAARVACIDGDITGCMMAGDLVDRGFGVKQDDAEALAFFERACAGGEAHGCERASELR
jgi:TPR repeat protein